MNLPKVLIVDDESGFTRLLKRVFYDKLHKYEIYEVNDPLRALDAACECKPDVILMDVLMPAMDGLELAACFRADYEFCRVPIIIMESHLSKEQKETTHSSGMLGGFPFISRPFSQQVLIDCIERNLQARL